MKLKHYLTEYLESNKITNKDFCNRVGISPKHLIDITSGTRNISAQVIDKISFVTDIPLAYIYEAEANYKIEREIEEYLKKNKLTVSEYLDKFNPEYLIKENFLEFSDPSNKLSMLKDIVKFLRTVSLEKLYEIDKAIYYRNDKPELLLLWLEKGYREALNRKVKKYNSDNIKVLVDYIVECAKKGEFNEKKLVKKFSDNGMNLIIMDDMPGCKIRGAFRVHRGIPAIYLTRNYERIADFYFALLHELAHCKSDFNKGQANSLVSYIDYANESDDKVDIQALDWMVPNNYYENICCSEYYNINHDKNHPKAFIVYRLAKDNFIGYDSKEYNLYNPVIKQTILRY